MGLCLIVLPFGAEICDGKTEETKLLSPQASCIYMHIAKLSLNDNHPSPSPSPIFNLHFKLNGAFWLEVERRRLLRTIVILVPERTIFELVI